MAKVASLAEYRENRWATLVQEEEEIFGEENCPICERACKPTVVEKGHEYKFECRGVGDDGKPLHKLKTWIRVVPTRMF